MYRIKFKFVPLLTFLLFCTTSLRAEYHVESRIGKGKLDSMTQLAVGKNDTLLALDKNGRLLFFKPDGTFLKTVETGLHNTDALAVDEEGKIYVFSTLTIKRKVKVGARMRMVAVPNGVQCEVLSPDGEKLETKTFDSLKSARAARVVGDKIVVADQVAKSLVFFDRATGKETARVKKGLRLCCGIFDFSVAPENTIVVANLGAFKVQRFDLNGKELMEFGKRGRDICDFQGCCNPVSVAYLPDGRIVTAEKDPSRIKVYDAKGEMAHQIPDVENLVKSCTFIPMAVDSKGTIYLGANAKGYIVKCSP